MVVVTEVSPKHENIDFKWTVVSLCLKKTLKIHFTAVQLKTVGVPLLASYLAKAASSTMFIGLTLPSALKSKFLKLYIYKSTPKCPEIVATHGQHIHAVHGCNWFNSTCKCGITKLFRRFGLGGRRVRTVHRKKNFNRRGWENMPEYFLSTRREGASIHFGTYRWRLSSYGIGDENYELAECQTGGLLALRRLSCNNGQ